MKAMEIKNLFFSYKQYKVLKDISYVFQTGKIYSIIGHNGAGKTTLIRLCLGLINPKMGVIDIKGSPEIAYVPDRGGLYEFLTAKENIKTFLRLNNIDQEHIEPFIQKKLSKWGLTDQANIQIRYLSMGQRQRVSMILAEVNNPDLIFLDEPTNSIDIVTKKLLIKHLINLRDNGKTIIITSHDIQLIEDVSDEIIILDQHVITYHNEMSKIHNLTETYNEFTERIDENE